MSIYTEVYGKNAKFSVPVGKSSDGAQHTLRFTGANVETLDATGISDASKDANGEIERRGKNNRPARRNRSGPEPFSGVPDFYSISM